MHYRPFQSIAEALTYALLLLVLVFNIATVTITLHAIRQERSDTQTVESQMQCIGAFFLSNNRQSQTLKDFKQCYPLVEKVK